MTDHSSGSTRAMGDRLRSNMAAFPRNAAWPDDDDPRALALVGAQEVRRNTSLTWRETTIVNADGSGNRLSGREIEQRPFGSGLERHVVSACLGSLGETVDRDALVVRASQTPSIEPGAVPQQFDAGHRAPSEDVGLSHFDPHAVDLRARLSWSGSRQEVARHRGHHRFEEPPPAVNGDESDL